MAAPDLSEFHALSKPKRGLCKMGRALEEIPEEERGALEAALGEDSGIITNAAILQWLQRREVGFVSNPALTAHRRGSCSCVR